MQEDIDIKENYIKQLDEELLSILLKDRSSGKNIIWATDIYASRGQGYQSHEHISISAVTGRFGQIIRPRTNKSKKEQQIRVKDKAEVFTPSWICNEMANHLDNEYFGKKNVFNIENGTKWETTKNKIDFSGLKTNWQDYVKRKVLEITCGEAPFLVSRYDTVTGEWIEPDDRVGVLDRKLRIISENVEHEKDWVEWSFEAFKTTFGYEWQGDSLLIARENLLFTFIDYYIDKFKNYPIKEYLIEIAKILSWNIWQMDGLKYVIPNSCKPIPKMQMSLFDDEEMEPCQSCLRENNNHHTGIYCKIMNWTTKRSIKFYKGDKKMKFDFIIGNPPYNKPAQKTSTSDDPIYHVFMDAAYNLSDKVMLITPARFLMNAGKTPSNWNHKMLDDVHLKVISYEKISEKVFPSASIPGGIVVTYHDNTNDYGAIKHFVPSSLLSDIFAKVSLKAEFVFDKLIYTQSKFNLINLYNDKPYMKDRLGSEGKDKRFPEIFSVKKTNEDDARILGLINKKREYRYISRKYIEEDSWLDNYKVFVPFSNGSVLSDKQETIIGNPVIGKPGDGITQTFICIGDFKKEHDAENLLKYIKTKFARIMLCVLKVTQGNKAETWHYVPMQNFTNNSDIDWSKSVHEIDMQLYNKYGLTNEEVAFIESHVKEMK